MYQRFFYIYFSSLINELGHFAEINAEARKAMNLIETGINILEIIHMYDTKYLIFD